MWQLKDSGVFGSSRVPFFTKFVNIKYKSLFEAIECAWNVWKLLDNPDIMTVQIKTEEMHGRIFVGGSTKNAAHLWNWSLNFFLTSQWNGSEIFWWAFSQHVNMMVPFRAVIIFKPSSYAIENLAMFNTIRLCNSLNCQSFRSTYDSENWIFLIEMWDIFLFRILIWKNQRIVMRKMFVFMQIVANISNVSHIICRFPNGLDNLG